MSEQQDVSFVARLRPMPGRDADSEWARLRKVLKALGRRHGFRCEEVRQVNSPGVDGGRDGGNGRPGPRAD